MKKILIVLMLLSTVAYSAPRIKIACGAPTAKGSPCQMSVKKIGDKCRWHNAESPRCTGIKKDGTKCRMVVKSGQLFCHLHKNHQ